MDLSDCDIVKKVHITLQEKPIIPIAFDALVSMFPPKAQVEIEALPGYHDVQQRNWFAPDVDHSSLLDLGNAKTLSILRDDGHALNEDVEEYRSLEDQQLRAYEFIAQWAKRFRTVSFGERDLHFGGKIIANNEAKAEIDVINWRHARLQKIIPDHVLYGTTQPHYNFRKTKLEHYCDLSQILDKYFAKHPDKQALVTELKDFSKLFCADEKSLERYRADCRSVLKTASVNDKNIIKAINYMCLQDYFKELDQTISTHVLPGNPLHENLQNLRHTLAVELAAEIESGKTLKQIDQSNAVKIITNTDSFIKSLYTTDCNPAQKIEAADHYVNENIRLGRNWHLGSKIIAGALLCVAAAAVGCIIGAAIGLAIGFACGAITGPGSLITAAVGAFLGGFKGAMVAATVAGGVVALGVGVYGANLFFKPSESETQIQALANTVKVQEESKLEAVIEIDPHRQNEQLAL